jgi:methyltransferase, putative, TIGR00027 family
MHDHTASRTALGVAYIRAAHQLLDRPPLLFADPLALKLLGPDSGDAIHGMIERHQNPYGRGLRSHVCLRSRYAEDKLAEEVKAGARWYVLVGAGFDTFAYRQPAWAKRLRIIEVDHPATQAAKKQMLAAAGIEPPDNLSFAAADFTRQTLGDVLGKLGIAPAEGVCFSWLGVTMYLPEDTIAQSLQAMASVSERASLTLTFRQPPDPAVPSDKAFDDMVAAMGEPFVSAFTPEAISAKLTEYGFTRQELLTPDLAREQYFTPVREDLPPPRRATILHAAR